MRLDEIRYCGTLSFFLCGCKYFQNAYLTSGLSHPQPGALACLEQ
jgi:hypothetical protein